MTSRMCDLKTQAWVLMEEELLKTSPSKHLPLLLEMNLLLPLVAGQEQSGHQGSYIYRQKTWKRYKHFSKYEAVYMESERLLEVLSQALCRS